MIKKKIVLAYLNKLSTLIIIKWLQKKNFEIIIFLPLIEEKFSIDLFKKNVKKFNLKYIFIKNLKYIYIKKYIFPFLKFNIKNKDFFLIEQIIIKSLFIKEIVKIAFYFNCKYIVNNIFYDKIKLNFNSFFKYFNNNIKIINPFKIWKLSSKKKFFNFCVKNNIKLYNIKNNIEKNVFFLHYKNNLNCKINKKKYFILNEISLEHSIYFSITFKKGIPIKLNNINYKSEELILKLKKIGIITGISRKIFLYSIKKNLINDYYQSSPFLIIKFSKQELESLIFNKDILDLKSNISLLYLNNIFLNGIWNNERFIFQNIIDYIQNKVNGIVKLKIFKGLLSVIEKIAF